MALPEIDELDLQYLDSWFANLVDTLNYDLQQLEDVIVPTIPALNNVLTNIDTAPIQYLKESLQDMVVNINEAFTQIEDRLAALEAKEI
jgi:hypothetical protein